MDDQEIGKGRRSTKDQHRNLRGHCHDPYPTLKKVKCPVLAINGEKDLQVPPKENLSAIEKALKEGGNNNYKIVEMPGLNHLFQKSATGSPTEYANIEETFSKEAMKVIADWILEVTK